MENIKNTIENYYNMSLEDRNRFISILYEIYDKYKYEFQYGYDEILSTIEQINSLMIKAKNFEFFYDGLNAQERKEFQTQVYLKSAKAKSLSSNYDSKIELYSKLIEACDSIKDSKKENITSFVLDVDSINKDFEEMDDLFDCEIIAERIISSFGFNYYHCAFNYLKNLTMSLERRTELSKRYYEPFINEFNSIMQKCVETMRNNMNDSTKAIFDTLTPNEKFITISGLLNISKERLYDISNERKKLREQKKVEKLHKITQAKQYVKNEIPKTVKRKRVITGNK